MTIVLVRHGSTALNHARVLQPEDTPLDVAGHAQAEAVAAALVALAPAALCSSDLPRAVQTAAAIGRACGLAPAHDELLRERNFGALRGQAYDGLGFDPLTMAEAPLEGESAAEFASRARQAFEAMQSRRRQLTGPLIVVTHGLLIRAILAGPVGMAPGALAALHIGNTSVTVLSADPPHVPELLASTQHLSGSAGDDLAALVGG